jgi:hypothetical protein
MAAHIDISYIVKRLKDFKRGIIDLDNLADGIFIDMDIKKDSLKKSQVKDHLESLETSFALGNIKDSDIPALAREIYYMNFLPKNESKMIIIKRKKISIEYAKKLIGKRLNEESSYNDLEFIGPSVDEILDVLGKIYDTSIRNSKYNSLVKI